MNDKYLISISSCYNLRAGNNRKSFFIIICRPGETSVDYLLKPISFERFLKAVNKVMQTSLDSTGISDTIHLQQMNLNEAFINLRSDRKNLKILLDDILYIESLKDYIKVVTKTKNIVTKQSISSVEELLPKNNFARIHRSFIVALNKIESFTNDTVEVAKQELPISRMYRRETEKLLNGFQV